MSSTRPALPLTGGCSCGAIRYEIVSFPLLLYACNCTDCQKASGSAFALNMPVLARDFHVLQGEPKGWPHLSPKGVAVTSRFCGDCGGRIYGERAGRAEIVNLRAGTLDDTSWLVPVAHIFMKSAQSWVEPAADAGCYETQPADFNTLTLAWRAMWPEFFPKK
ncbi:MAG: aldehyde-activating protein [Bradyrhizobium sp.]|uniref:GFA family protein n=1 Tax=Bradyrhizobium sp. TaxID=376 RepID=UPI0011FC43E1|nr:GFA family protein [Bradyrhizobium sp.]THD61214.1 MAG: aldehyde-activating protein [Bradyrhizobium sp.]